MNKTIEWFDWADDEPNNYDHNEMCLVLREYHDPFWPIVSLSANVEYCNSSKQARDYFWNDETCDRPAHFICENRCAAF